MEIKDLSTTLDEIKNRFSSRFITYFIIYWLIFHWQISVALFWYDKTQIQAEGCKSIFEFIKDQLTNNNYFWNAVWSALGSTIAFPIIKTGILALDAFIIVKRKNLISKINKDELYQENLKLQNKLNRVGDLSILYGDWRYIEYDALGKGIAKQIYINNSTWYVLLEDKREEKYQIVDFFYDPLNSTMIFTTILLSNSKEKNTFRLTFENSNFNELNGNNSNNVKVGFRRF